MSLLPTLCVWKSRKNWANGYTYDADEHCLKNFLFILQPDADSERIHVDTFGGNIYN